jgi:hypothetical protein
MQKPKLQPGHSLRLAGLSTNGVESSDLIRQVGSLENF